MIYRITVKHGEHDIDIYAHPAWPFTVGSNGDPTDDYLVLFPPTPMLKRVVPRVFATTKIDAANVGVLPGTYHREVEARKVTPIEDLSTLG